MSFSRCLCLNTYHVHCSLQFRYADKLDVVLLLIGIIAAAATGATFPLMLQLYQKVANVMIDYSKIQSLRARLNETQWNNSLSLETSSGW